MTGPLTTLVLWSPMLKLETQLNLSWRSSAGEFGTDPFVIDLDESRRGMVEHRENLDQIVESQPRITS